MLKDKVIGTSGQTFLDILHSVAISVFSIRLNFQYIINILPFFFFYREQGHIERIYSPYGKGETLCVGCLKYTLISQKEILLKMKTCFVLL